ncbi:CHRD domain-containing protein [Bacillus manliponensis]|uniref:CHRD domain-containing protein n=1 Tax=Bacillus manliponensis TaxID=574376 RepID=UPI0035187E53
MKKHFFARLKGRHEVPPVQTAAYGVTEFILNYDGTKLYYKLTLKRIKKVKAIHIHFGTEVQNGPVVAFLFGPLTASISVDTGIITGILTNEDLEGPLQGKTIHELIQEMENGNTYVNVHTEKHPQGEVRGQIQNIH